MGAQPQNEEHIISIVEAVETLSNIIETDFEREEGGIEEEEESVSIRAVRWLKEANNPEGLKVVKDTFSVVLEYLRNFYKDDYHALTDDHTMEGIKSIMVLVGEAAKKLDRTSGLFSGKNRSVTQLKEYKKLQDFYRNRVCRKIDEGLLSKWILGLAKHRQPERKRKVRVKERKLLKTQHLFIDLDEVKQDVEYELFLIRKEDGLRFFNPRLIRNMKLICDFSSYMGSHVGDNPLYNAREWEDRIMQAAAASLLKAISTQIDLYYKETVKYRQREMVVLLNKALMSLLLSGHPNNLMHNEPTKSCRDYFYDFQTFLSDVMHCRDYQKLIAYPPEKENHLGHALLDMVHSLCQGIYLYMKGYHETVAVVEDVIELAIKEGQQGVLEIESEAAWQRLAYEYQLAEELIKKFPNGPLMITLDHLESGGVVGFNPLHQGNLPSAQYTFYFHDRKIANIRIPSPTSQEFINKAAITDEFNGFLRSILDDPNSYCHLIVNLQDSTSWREVSRCRALEALGKSDLLESCLPVITLATDTDFYHQLAPYDNEGDATLFMEHFLTHLTEERAGYFFPTRIKEALFPEAAEKIMKAIHRIFFWEKESLSKDERLNFIQIFYLFFTLQCLDLVNPDSFSFTCKDAIDIGGSFNALLFAFIKQLRPSGLHDQDYECLHSMLYGPSLLIRERLIQSERFHRFISALQAIEEARQEYGASHFPLIIKEAFEPLYTHLPIHDIEAVPPKN